MKIEYNEKEIAAMAEFHKGNRAEGLRLQEEFASEFRKEYADKDHCPCQKACRYHNVINLRKKISNSFRIDIFFLF